MRVGALEGLGYYRRFLPVMGGRQSDLRIGYPLEDSFQPCRARESNASQGRNLQVATNDARNFLHLVPSVSKA